MVKKFDVITKLYEEATQEVTESPEKWIAFLQSASKNYRLPFDEQLLIHVQRPEATAVLPMEKWNEKFGRWVKRDSKGIAVFDKSSDRLKLKYYLMYPIPEKESISVWCVRSLCGVWQKNNRNQ